MYEDIVVKQNNYRLNYKLKIYGITGDCPALKLILNFIGHGGYCCCWFCYLKGEHIGNKRQYYHQQQLVMRGTKQYSEESVKAEQKQTNIYGHLGKSILENLLDVPLPQAIIIDYLHVTLLGLAKTIILSIYHQLIPIQRTQLDEQLKQQQFPHFFNRKMRAVSNFAYVKATELRNMLFYGILPNLEPFLSNQQLSHLSLFICAIRLLHSQPTFGKATSQIADQLFNQFYRDHNLYYTGLQNFVLHLHAHYS
ncbi:unnamed protein product [Didymodactylos carnosus]|uniref:Transposase n=1 Tax=Didymodactylos carnosus TaxID=1234261 RepID=A0A815D9Z7_9BILA|nr:unnamed protein product [Didymodactylos carnosus]CAF4105591.1 unnamed protein product [Didymodactylos carnosus]